MEIYDLDVLTKEEQVKQNVEIESFEFMKSVGKLPGTNHTQYYNTRKK